jgi:hypothetical protein
MNINKHAEEMSFVSPGCHRRQSPEIPFRDDELSMGNLGNPLVSIGHMLSWIDASIDNQFYGVDSWSKSKFTDASTSMGLKQIQVL